MKLFADWEPRPSWPLAIATFAAILFIALTLFYYSKIPSVLGQLAFLPILWAALVFEWRGGIPASLCIAFIMCFEIKQDQLQANEYWLPMACLYFLFGVICSGLSDLRKRHIQTAESKVLQVSEMYTRMLNGLASTLEIRDCHTQGHSERVAKNALILGRAIGLQEAQLNTLYWSGLLHDLGKIAIPEVILLKPGKLSDNEFAEVKQHPAYGADLLSSVTPEFREIALAVRHHHERWDGLGYPKGLYQTDIPLMSRIISISDVFEALTSHRPYRQPLLPNEAMAYLKEGSGTLFDPNLVNVFEKCFERGAIRYLPESASSIYESRISVIQTTPMLETEKELKELVA
jgi:hypothetical protein